MPIIGPKVELHLQRYTSVTDGGGQWTKTWTLQRRVLGTLSTIRRDNRVANDRETSYATHYFWVDKTSVVGLNISQKDEFSRPSTTYRYRVMTVDNVVEMDQVFRIELEQIK